MRFTSLAVLAALLLAAPLTQPFAQPTAARAVISHCQVYLIDDVDVSAQQTGSLVRMNVRQGDSVQEGQLLAQIDDRQAQLQKLAAELDRDAEQARADDDIEVRYAIKSHELAKVELQQDLEINRRSPGAVPRSEIRRKQLAENRAELAIDRSKLNMRIAQMTADVKNSAVMAAEDSILKRRVVAPFEGMIVDIHHKNAEWVDAGEPLLRVVRMDRLRVDGFVDGNLYNPSDVAHCAVTVEIQLAHGRKETFEGDVTYVSPIVSVGNKYRLQAEVANRTENGQPLLRQGMTATMVIHLR
ncbi:MAG: efflux RND transporter periplasmic adaptor subunit [Pirellulaceae bacterium]